MENNIIFENERYIVYTCEFPGAVTNHGAEYFNGYAVQSKEHAIVEVYTPQLVDALSTAEQLDLAMEQQPWQWVRIQAEADKTAGEGEVH